MLMKLEDLEPGDVIRVKDEIRDLYRNLYSDWVNKWCDKDIKIYNIEIGEDIIKIYSNIYDCIRINKDGTARWDRFTGIPFKIIALKED